MQSPIISRLKQNFLKILRTKVFLRKKSPNIAILSVQDKYSERVLLGFLPTLIFFIILQTGRESQDTCLKLFL